MVGMKLPLAGHARVIGVGLGWVAAAVVAGFIGLTAIGAVGEGIVGLSTTPLSADEVDRRLAASASGEGQNAASTPPVTSSPTTAPSPTATAPVVTPPPSATSPPAVPDPPATEPPPTQPPPASETRLISTAGGNVLTQCRAASPQIVSATPAQGFQREIDPDEGEGEARVEFESEELRVRVEITCVDGEPSWTVGD